MTGECKKENRSKVKIEKWIGEPDLSTYEKFVMQWKLVLEATRQQMKETVQQMMQEDCPKTSSEKIIEQQKALSMSLLQKYYLSPFGDDFFVEFCGRE